MSFSAAKRFGKRVIGYPETSVPVASSVDYVAQIFDSPVSRVWAFSCFLADFTDTGFLDSS